MAEPSLCSWRAAAEGLGRSRLGFPTSTQLSFVLPPVLFGDNCRKPLTSLYQRYGRPLRFSGMDGTIMNGSQEDDLKSRLVNEESNDRSTVPLSHLLYILHFAFVLPTHLFQGTSKPPKPLRIRFDIHNLGGAPPSYNHVPMQRSTVIKLLGSSEPCTAPVKPSPHLPHYPHGLHGPHCPPYPRCRTSPRSPPPSPTTPFALPLPRS
jgi:hypothetical protein